MPNATNSLFRLVGGLNSDSSLLEFPSGFSSDEQNYEFQIDGSRRRRKGLALEAGGAVIDTAATPVEASAWYTVHKWKNAGNIPQKDLLIFQQGRYLRFFDDSDPASTPAVENIVDLAQYMVEGTTLVDLDSQVLDISSGRGHAIVTGKFISPVYLDYTIVDGTPSVSASQIDIIERDFEGADDGIDVTATPTEEIASHIYNLMNRGWTSTHITAYETALNQYPAKNMLPWLGLARTLTASNAYNEDGIRQFSPDKLVAELWQNSTAPMGHFTRDPFNTTRLSIPGGDVSFAIETWTSDIPVPGPVDSVYRTITITTAGAHGLTAGDFITISHQSSYYLSYAPIPDTRKTWHFRGRREVMSVPSTTTFTLFVPGPTALDTWTEDERLAGVGTVHTQDADNPSGELSPYRPTANAFFAGRVFYAGTPYKRLGTKIFFSQVVESDAQYGLCYQVADPTDERISDLVPTDGGTIVIPEANYVHRLVPHGASLLVFASNGVWQIGPGEPGYFSATSYSIRKLTESGSVGPETIVNAENIPVYWGFSDIYAIVADQYTGQLVAQNVSSPKINNYYNSELAGVKTSARGSYDDKTKVIVWLCDTVVPSALVYDLRFQAFTRYTFGVGLADKLAAVFNITGNPTSNIPKTRYVSVTGDTVTFNTLSDITFADLDTNEEPAYMHTAYDTAGDPATKGSTPYVTVFSRKTETGYSIVGDQYQPIGASSTLMQARWDWADNSIAGKWGTPQEIYRRARLYIPEDPSTDTFADGVPLVVTKNMVRGQGRSLQLLFRAGPGKDSWIQGFKVYHTKGRMP